PMAPASAEESDRAAVLGCQPRATAASRIRRRVPSETPDRPMSANDTAAGETPARRAMSVMVGRRMLPLLHAGPARKTGGASMNRLRSGPPGRAENGIGSLPGLRRKSAGAGIDGRATAGEHRPRMQDLTGL